MREKRMQFSITGGNISPPSRYTDDECHLFLHVSYVYSWIHQLHFYLTLSSNYIHFQINESAFIKQVAYHTPPRFPIDVMETIREGASLVFKGLGLCDFARIDGWYLPNLSHESSCSVAKFGRTESGTVVYTDINLVLVFFLSRWLQFY